MNLMEQKRRNDAFLEVENQFKEKYPRKTFGKNSCFVAPNGVIFRPFEFPDDNALAIEYAETPEDAARNRFEDGDRFYLTDFPRDTLFRVMIAEIER